MAAGSQAGLDTVFDFGSGNTLTLEGVVLSELIEDDFGFGGGVGNSKSEGPSQLLEDVSQDVELPDFDFYDNGDLVSVWNVEFVI